MSRIAVIIPLYNHERHIGAALRSVFAQTRRPDRLVIVDDGSSDGSVAAARAALESAPAGLDARLETQPNAGAHAALNRAVGLAADCDLVAVLNSDDCYLPRRLETAAAVLETRPDAALVCTGLRLIDGEGAPLPPEEPRAKWFEAVWSLRAAYERGEISLPEWLGIANFPATTSNFVARRAWLEARPFRDYRYAHDYFALLTAAVEGALVIEPEPLLEYRVHASNTITTAPAKLMAELLRVMLELPASLAPLLRGSAAARARWAACQRAMWANVSGVRQDLLQAVTAGLLAELPPGAAARAAAEWAQAGAPELAEFPNKAAVNLRPPGAELTDLSALAARVEALRRERDVLKERARALEREARALRALEKSRWVRLGRRLGALRGISG